MDGKGNGKKSQGSQPTEVKVSGEDLTQLIAYLQGLQVGATSTEASSSKQFTLSPIAKSKIGTQDSQRPDTKVLSKESVKYWTTLGGPQKIRRLCSEEQVVAPLCRSREVVEAKDLVTGKKAVVLKNAGSCYNVEVADFTEDNTLPTFSLSFTEFESEGFLFHTTWQRKVGIW
jgi:hypothetical protein